MENVLYPIINSMGITLAIFQVYINSMEQMISQDALTQLKNRNELIKYLSDKMKNNDRRKNLYLLMMDADYFKKINDQYGHMEGDNALVCIAEVLREVGVEKEYFVARYGGDEFIVIYEAE